VQQVFDAFRDDGPDALVDLLAEDVEWEVRRDLPDAKTYRGRDGVRELVSGFEDVLDEQWYTPQDFIEAGDEIVVPLRWGGRGKGSGVPFEEREETWVFSVRNGKVSRVREYGTKHDALEAVGLSE